MGLLPESSERQGSGGASADRAGRCPRSIFSNIKAFVFPKGSIAWALLLGHAATCNVENSPEAGNHPCSAGTSLPGPELDPERQRALTVDSVKSRQVQEDPTG
ncbi:hypothetical protein CB1_000443009 [Camelus ferus]|nr:hypothetical protein CB1_000443009 [Camelus ferus]